MRTAILDKSRAIAVEEDWDLKDSADRIVMRAPGVIAHGGVLLFAWATFLSFFNAGREHPLPLLGSGVHEWKRPSEGCIRPAAGVRIGTKTARKTGTLQYACSTLFPPPSFPRTEDFVTGTRSLWWRNDNESGRMVNACNASYCYLGI